MTCSIEFTTEATQGQARAGHLKLRRGTIATPVFMPVGTQAAVRATPPTFLREAGAQIILANAYHLSQRPGHELIEKMGGLHDFMGVDLPILTDSGGFQVFSLEKRTVNEEGVKFRYEVDGKQTFLSPEVSMQIQQSLGSDIAMAFDECLPADSERLLVERSIARTERWARRCLEAHTREDQSLFGIVQGALFHELREKSAAEITALPFDGFAIGGLAVGETPAEMYEMAGYTAPFMPVDKPRYLMGVGRPQDLVECVRRGIDMFDCVIPTRHARGGLLYTFRGRVRISDRRYRRDKYPIDRQCDCYTCRTFSRAYLHHLFRVNEILSATLATIHNIHFFADLMARLREGIVAGTFDQAATAILEHYPLHKKKK